ncbi:MAG: tol-pal system protein YbgF [Gammaproteobacteria bacterium]|nr:tol-pal system protein YbgF [Gammaproteobacteria bacterium]
MKNRLAICFCLLCAACAENGRAATPATPVTPPAPLIEARVTKLEQMLESQVLVEMLTRLERLQAEVQRLQGDTEVQSNDIERLKQRQRDLSQDIDRRLRQIEQAQAAAKAAPPPEPAVQTPPPAPPAASAAAASSATSATLDVSREQVMYQRGLDGVKVGRYDQAITDFEAFLASYPKSEFAGNAQYWIGEANYVSRRFDKAATSFKKVIDTYPASNKLPDAMVKLGFSYQELGDREQARKTLNDVVARYPDSPAARLAKERLQKLK